MTPAPVSMKCLTARPERGAIRPSIALLVSELQMGSDEATGSQREARKTDNTPLQPQY